MSLFRDLCSVKNLRLAWTRIRTATNIEYKNEFREVYDAYEVALDANLASLSYALRHGVYKPSGSERYMKPKASGLLRPYTLLTIEDQIVYQAFANVIICRFWEQRQLVQNVVAYSNTFQGPTSQFMFDPWKDSLARFNRRVSNLKSSGRNIVAKFDLSAYFDTISHILLIEQISGPVVEDGFCNLLGTCLKTWTPRRIGHGIPQGPAASSVLAEIVLLPIDESFRTSSSHARYARYVDDVQIIGRSPSDVHREVVRLDEMCKEFGLIPHSDKLDFGTKANDTQRGVTPSLAEADLALPSNQAMAEERFIGSLSSRRSRIDDTAAARFILFRARPSAKITKKVLDLVLVHPEQCDAFGEYLKRVLGSRLVIKRLLPLLESGMPYDRQEATYWDVVWMTTDPSVQRSIVVAASKRLGCLPGSFRSSKLALFKILLSCKDLSAIQHGVQLLAREQSPALVSRAIGTIPPSILYAAEAAEFVGKCLSGTNVDVAITAATLIGLSQSDASALVTGLADMNPAARVTLERLGVLPASKKRCIPSIATHLSRRYDTPTWHGWRRLMGKEYVWGNEQLVISERWFDNQSHWLGIMDSFCNLIIENVFAWITANRPGERPPKVIDSKGERIDYGSLLESRNYLRGRMPKLYVALKSLHVRRNNLPSSHHRDKRTGRLSRSLTKIEQKRHVAQLADGFAELVQVLAAMGLR